MFEKREFFYQIQSQKQCSTYEQSVGSDKKVYSKSKKMAENSQNTKKTSVLYYFYVLTYLNIYCNV